MDIKKPLAQIKKELKSHYDKKQAEFLAGYINTKTKLYGLKIGLIRNLGKKVVKGKTFDELLPIIDKLLKSKIFEEIALGLFLLEHFQDELIKKETKYWKYLERFINNVDNWAHSDWSCGIRNKLLQSKPSRIKDLRKWVLSKNPWKRRGALITLIKWTKGCKVTAKKTDVLWMVEKTLDDKHFYVQRATGWVLRDLSEQYPKEVFEYIKKNNHRMASVTRSTAMEKLKKKGCKL